MLFFTSNFDQLTFLSPLRYEGVTYYFRKPKAIPIENKNKIRIIYTLRGEISNLLKVVLFHSNQFYYTVDGAFPVFIPESKRILQVLSNEVSFVFEFQWEHAKKSQNV